MSGYMLNEFLTLDSLRNCLLRINPPSFWKEEKPDTLMPNSCGVCGASFVDHGSLACSDDVCFYDERNKGEQVMQDILQKIEAEALAVNTMEPQVEAKPHAPRAPKEAERYWPAMRVKNFIRQMNKTNCTKPPRMNHMEGLEYMASRAKMTVEELLKTTPPSYLDHLGLDAYSKSLYHYGNSRHYY
jgi:hypothetical protein